MARFLFWFVVFVLVGGLLLHYKVELPNFISWIGKLPGDMKVIKDKVTYYLPLTSALVFSIAFTLFLSLFSKKEKS
jgi:hypothetical protein